MYLPVKELTRGKACDNSCLQRTERPDLIFIISFNSFTRNYIYLDEEKSDRDVWLDNVTRFVQVVWPEPAG